MQSHTKTAALLIATVLFALVPAAVAGAETLTLEQLKSRYEANQTLASPAHEYAVALARAGKTADALAILKRLSAEHPANDLILFDRLVIHTWAGEYREAIALYESGKRKNLPGYALAAMGGAYYRTGEYGKALDLYCQLSEQGDDRARLWQAETLTRLDEIEAANHIYEELAASQPGNYQIYLSRGIMRIESNDPVSAQADIDSALRLAAAPAQEAGIRREAAAAFIRNGEYARGIALLKPLIGAAPADRYIQSDYILALRRNGDYKTAIREASRIWPDLLEIPPYGLQALADSNLRLGNAAEANRIYRMILKKQPDFHSVKWGLAYTYMLNGDVESGISLYRDLLTAQPALAVTAQDDAAALNRSGHVDAAKRLYTTVMDLFPDNLVFRREFADDLSANGLYRAAYEQYAIIAAMPNGDMPGQAGMAKSAVRIGDYQTASSHIAMLQTNYARNVYAMPALKLYEMRRQGGAEINASSTANYQQEETFRLQTAADTQLGGSYSLLAGSSYDRLSEQVDYGNGGRTSLRSHINRYSLGIGHVGLYHDYKLWHDDYQTTDHESGFRLQTRYFLEDDRLVLGLNVSRSPLKDAQTLASDSSRISSTQYDLTLSGRVGLQDNYLLGLSTTNYSDDNSRINWNAYWNHALLDTGSVNYNWFAFASEGRWKRQELLYDSPTSRVSYGAGLYGHWEIPAGYWAATATFEWGADRPDPIDFTPTIRLEYGHTFSPGQELVIGAEYGLRTNRLRHSSSLRYNVRQFDMTYRWNW